MDSKYRRAPHVSRLVENEQEIARLRHWVRHFRVTEGDLFAASGGKFTLVTLRKFRVRGEIALSKAGDLRRIVEKCLRAHTDSPRIVGIAHKKSFSRVMRDFSDTGEA